MNNNYMFVDLSRLIEAPRCAVFFQTVEEVECFYHNCENSSATTAFSGYLKI